MHPSFIMGKKGKKPRKQEVNTRAEPSPEAAFPGSLALAPALAGEAMTESSSKQEHSPELGLEDFPPLMPPSGPPWSPTKKQLYAMIAEVKGRLVAVEGRLVEGRLVEGRLVEGRLVEGRLVAVEGRLDAVEGRLVAVEEDLKEFKVLGHHWSQNDLIFCAAEILKWSVNLRGEEHGDGKQFFRHDLFAPLVVGSKVMGMSL